METPDKIWLIECVFEVSECLMWCDEPNPGGLEPAPDSVEYVRVDKDNQGKS